jgi:hypothetical protein
MDNADVRITPVGPAHNGGNDLAKPTNCNSMFIAALTWYFGTVQNIVRGEVGSPKLCERWAPKCLTEEHKNLCFGVSLSHLQPLKKNEGISWNP